MQRSLTRSMIRLSMTSSEIGVNTSEEMGGASIISTYKIVKLLWKYNKEKAGIDLSWTCPSERDFS